MLIKQISNTMIVVKKDAKIIDEYCNKKEN